MNPLELLLLCFAALLLLFVFLLFLPIRLAVCFDKKIRLSLKILCFSFLLYPKKKKWRMKEHLPEYQKKKKKKSDKKPAAKSTPQSEGGKKESAVERIARKYEEITDLLNTVIFPAAKRLGKHLTVSISRIELTIGSDDAAKTALLYAAAVNGGYALLALIDEHTNLKKKGKGLIGVTCRYDLDKTSITFDIELALSLFGAISILLPTLVSYLQRTSNNDL